VVYLAGVSSSLLDFFFLGITCFAFFPSFLDLFSLVIVTLETLLSESDLSISFVVFFFQPFFLINFPPHRDFLIFPPPQAVSPPRSGRFIQAMLPLSPTFLLFGSSASDPFEPRVLFETPFLFPPSLQWTTLPRPYCPPRKYGFPSI